MYNSHNQTSLVPLPTTEKEFDELIDAVMVAYPNIPEREHAIAVISVAIRHLPNEQATATLEYFGHTVLKSLANHVAHFKGEKVRHETQVNQHISALTTNPNDAQARDQLEKWVNEGSTYAKEALTQFENRGKEPTTDGSNVLPIKAI